MYLLPADIMQAFKYCIDLNLMSSQKRKHLKRDNMRKKIT